MLSKITLCKTNLIITVKYIHIKKFLTASFNDFIVVGTFQVTKLFSFFFLKKKIYSLSIELKHSEILRESVQKSCFCPGLFAHLPSPLFTFIEASILSFWGL